MYRIRVLSRATARAADCGQDQRKNRQDRKRKQRQSDRKRKQRQSASEGIIKKVKGDDAERRLAKQRNVWQTTEPVKGRPTMYQQVISIIGKLNHRIPLAQVTSLSF